MIDPGDLRKSDLEQAQEVPVEGNIGERVSRIERAFDTELTGSMSLNVRGTALMAAPALAILLLAQFSAIWLDDKSWTLPGVLDWVMLYILLPGSVLFLLVCMVLGALAVWPKRRWAEKLRRRIDHLGKGETEEEARLLLEMLESQRATNERKSRLLRVASIPLGLAVVLVVAQAMIFAFAAEPNGRRSSLPNLIDQGPAGDLPPDEILTGLAETYAPRVIIHPREAHGPALPDDFIEASELLWHPRRGDDETVAARGKIDDDRLGAGCEDAPSGCYQAHEYLAIELTRPFDENHNRPQDLPLNRGFAIDPDASAHRGQVGRDPDAPVFYEFNPIADRLVLSYWFFYGYSKPHRPLNNLLDRVLRHEGDWENIDVVLQPGPTVASSMDYEPLAVRFYGHGHPQSRSWDSACKLVAGEDDEEIPDCKTDTPGHPIVYSAWDSHASYPSVGENKVCSDLGCACDVREDGFSWDSWRRQGGLVAVRAQDWFGFGGAWGGVGAEGGQTGPLGPSAYKRPASPDPGDLQSLPADKAC